MVSRITGKQEWINMMGQKDLDIFLIFKSYVIWVTITENTNGYLEISSSTNKNVIYLDMKISTYI